MQLRSNKKLKKTKINKRSNPSTTTPTQKRKKKKNTPQNNKIKQQQQKLTTAKKEMKKKIFTFMFYPADYYRIIVNEYDYECRAVHDYEHHA